MWPTWTRIAGPPNARHCSQNPASWCGTRTELCTPSKDTWPLRRASVSGGDKPEPAGVFMSVGTSVFLIFPSQLPCFRYNSESTVVYHLRLMIGNYGDLTIRDGMSLGKSTLGPLRAGPELQCARQSGSRASCHSYARSS